ncbi:MAG: CHAT domain-containing protein [Elainellaceae cyanobacterium]
MTQEFHVSITPVRGDEYLIRTEKVASGVPLAEQQMIWPVEDWLQQAQQLMGDPLAGLLRNNRLPAAIAAASAASSPDASGPNASDPNASDAAQSLLSLMDLGQQMYNHLFQGILRDSWLTAQGIAQHRSEILRLRLGLKGTTLPRLPWEVMHSSSGDGIGLAARPLATGTNVLFSRYQASVAIAQSNFAQHPSGQIRMLMVIAAPNDQEQLTLKQEARQLQQELGMRSATLSNGPVEGLPNIQVTILEQPGRKELAQALEQGHYQILHYAGHSDLASAGGQLYLVNSRTGLTEPLSGNDLAGLLVNNGVRVAVFNSCRGGYTAAGGSGSGRSLTEALINRGVPSVLAMAEQIPDDVALTLTRLLYRNIKQGYPIDLSLSRARQGLVAAYGSTQLYWALPTLYLHPDFNGYFTNRDRQLDNPADSLARVPHFHGITLPGSALGASPAEGNEYAAVEQIYLSEDELDDLAALELEEDIAVEPGLGVPAAEAGVYSDTYGDGYGDAYGNTVNGSPAHGEPIDYVDSNIPAASPDESTLAPRSNAATASEADAEQTAAEGGRIPWPQAHWPNSTRPNSHPNSHPNAAGTAVLAGSFWSRLISSRAVWLLLLLPVGLVMALGAIELAQRSDESSDNIPVEQVEGEVALDNLGNASTQEVMALASGFFSAGDIDSGEVALTELLDRGTLAEAEEVLQAVPDEQIADSRISFLQGRLEWEGIKRGDRDANVRDARRYWDFAVQQSPSPLYYNALGFALYTEGRTEAAMDAWLETLALLEQQGVAAYPGNPLAAEGQITLNVPEQITNPDALTAYAGIALTMAQMAAEPSPEQPADLLSKAVQIQQVVMQGDPVQFQPENLKQSWLWPNGMVEEWRILQNLLLQ